MKQTQIRMPEEALQLVQRAAAFLHTTYSDFMRQAGVEKARLMLGEEPRLPVFKQGSRAEQRAEPTDESCRSRTRC